MTLESQFARPTRRRLLHRVWVLCVAVSVPALSFIITGGGGGISQFNPHSLQTRGASEVTFWFGAIRLYRSAYEYHAEPPLVQSLVERGLVQPVQDQDRWDTISHWNSHWRGGDSFLYDVFTRRRSSILEWTDANPDLAKIYWSEAFHYLRSEYELDRQTGRDILFTGRREEGEESLRQVIRECRFDNLLWGRHSDLPVERAYAETELKKLRSQKSLR